MLTVLSSWVLYISLSVLEAIQNTEIRCQNLRYVNAYATIRNGSPYTPGYFKVFIFKKKTTHNCVDHFINHGIHIDEPDWIPDWGKKMVNTWLHILKWWFEVDPAHLFSITREIICLRYVTLSLRSMIYRFFNERNI